IVLFKKIRPRRGSLAVSIIWGSPIAASNRSAALAYRIGSLRHDSRYSAIDMSLWLLASNDLAKALNRESLYMTSLRICSASLPRRTPKTTHSMSNQRKHMSRLDTPRTPWRNAQDRHPPSYEQAIAYNLS